MKFLVTLIDDGSFMEEATPEEFQSMVDQMNEFINEMTEAGVYGGGEGLGPPDAAKTLRYGENGKVVVTDGPFAETKEQVNGYMILDCKDMDEAIDWIKRMPGGEPGGKGEGAIEIRAIFDTAAEVAEAYGRD